MTAYIIALVVCFLLSAFFSGAEMALSAANRLRLENAAEDGDRRAGTALALLDRFDSALGAILIGNNIVNIAATTLATVLFTQYYRSYGPTISTVVMTVVVLIFGEILPKNYAKNHAEKMVLVFAAPLRGLIFLLTPFAFLVLPKRDKKIFAAAIAIWIIAELVEFQPNDYDNNKLLFVWYAFTCGLISKWLCVLLHKIRFAFRKRFTKADTVRTNETCITILQAGFALYFLVKIVFSEGGSVQIPAGTLFTLFVICGYLLVLSVRTFVYPQHMLRRSILLLPILFSVFWIVMTGIIWYRQYAIDEIAFTSRVMIAAFALAALGAVVSVIRRMLANEQAAHKFSPGSIALTLGAYLLMFVMTVSSVMTIMRELKSEYQVYTKDEVALSEQIKTQTDADAVILANSYHWNLVTPTTGRSIVTGTSTFLFYHGIDNSQRERDVRAMFEHPEENAALFETYGVRYILVSNAERYNYDIDYAFLNSRCEVIAQTPSGTLYRVNS